MPRPNHPIAFNHMAHMAMLRNGRMVPIEQWSHQPKGPEVRAPKSKKEDRARKKTLELAVRRLKRNGPFG